jgi:dynein heavy chain
MVEDINNVINSGDVPALYKNEDFEGIYMVGKSECLRKSIPLSKMNMFSCYLGRVKQNIHIVLAFSPVGEIFRTRLRMFPSLVNCCTIDWFTEWPEEALMNVAKGIMQDGDLNLGDDEDLCVDMFKKMHQSVEHKSKKFLDELRRKNYVTPTSYLELLNIYKSVLKERRKFFGDSKRRLERGLEVLYEAAIEVANLREMLEKKSPEL